MATKDFSTPQEQQIAEYLGWEVVKGSGAVACLPGDICSENWLGECKTHIKSSKVSFDWKWWSKIKDEAMTKFRMPALFTDDGTQRNNHTWVVFPERHLFFDKVGSEIHRVIPDMSVRKNISFWHEDLLTEFKSWKARNPDFVAFSVPFCGEYVALTTLEEFKNFLETQNA